MLLTDSEEKLRSIRDAIDWRNNELKEVFSSCDLEDDAELGILYHPDIIILDLDCKFAELMAKISAMLAVSPQSHFLAYINYVDITFDETFVSLENVYFIARPISAAVNLNVARIIADVDSYQKRKYSATALNELLNEYIPIIRQHYLSMLLRQPIPITENVTEKFKTLHIDCPGPYYTVIVVDISSNRYRDNFEAISFLLLSAIKSAIIAENMQCYIFFDADFRINCLVGTGAKNVIGKIETAIDNIRSQFEHIINLSLRIGIGRTVSSNREIYHSFDDAIVAMESISFMKDNIVAFSNIDEKRQKELNYDRIAYRLNEFYFSCDYERYKQNRESCIEKIQHENGMEGLRRFTTKLIVSLADGLEKSGVDLTKNSFVADALLRISATADNTGILSILQWLDNRLENTRLNGCTQEHYLIQRATFYIEDNLSNKNLNLEIVSNFIGLSRTYFCKLFHDNMGESFSNYLRNQRIEHAKKLLKQTNLRAYEIAEQVGFSSAKYFSSSFKQVTGMTPLEFQQNNYSYVEEENIPKDL